MSFGKEAYGCLVHLAKAKARSTPGVLKKSFEKAWIRRWTGKIAYAVHDACAACLVEDPSGATMPTDGPEPALGDLLTLGL